AIETQVLADPHWIQEVDCAAQRRGGIHRIAGDAAERLTDTMQQLGSRVLRDPAQQPFIGSVAGAISARELFPETLGFDLDDTDEIGVIEERGELRPEDQSDAKRAHGMPQTSLELGAHAAFDV